MILLDVRGLHPFYVELAERFAQAGVHAVAIDYFGRTAGLGRAPRTSTSRRTCADPRTVQADIAAALGALRERTAPRRRRRRLLPGWHAVVLRREHPELTRRRRRLLRQPRARGDGALCRTTARDEMRGPVLGLYGGADEGIPPDQIAAFERGSRTPASTTRRHLPRRAALVLRPPLRAARGGLRATPGAACSASCSGVSSPTGAGLAASITPSISRTRQTSRRSSSTSTQTPAERGKTTWSPGATGILKSGSSGGPSPTARTMPSFGGRSWVPLGHDEAGLAHPVGLDLLDRRPGRRAGAARRASAGRYGIASQPYRGRWVLRTASGARGCSDWRDAGPHDDTRQRRPPPPPRPDRSRLPARGARGARGGAAPDRGNVERRA